MTCSPLALDFHHWNRLPRCAKHTLLPCFGSAVCECVESEISTHPKVTQSSLTIWVSLQFLLNFHCLVEHQKMKCRRLGSDMEEEEHKKQETSRALETSIIGMHMRPCVRGYVRECVHFFFF